MVLDRINWHLIGTSSHPIWLASCFYTSGKNAHQSTNHSKYYGQTIFKTIMCNWFPRVSQNKDGGFPLLTVLPGKISLKHILSLLVAISGNQLSPPKFRWQFDPWLCCIAWASHSHGIPSRSSEVGVNSQCCGGFFCGTYMVPFVPWADHILNIFLGNVCFELSTPYS